MAHGERRRRSRWTTVKPTEPTEGQKEAFMNMELRKMRRQLNGAKQRERKYDSALIFIFLVIIYAGAATHIEGQGVTVTIELWKFGVIGLWVLVSIVITSVLRDTKFISVLLWMLVYWPLIAILASLLFTDGRSIRTSDWIFALFIAAEVLTFVIFVWLHYINPMIIKSTWFRKKIGRKSFWHVSVISDWTMTYRYSKLHSIRVCKYIGEQNSRGMPHGIGKWMDDSHDGEILTGAWQDGEPVAPFVSRQYDTGDSFAAVSIAYFIATDDVFGANKMFPSNEQPSRCGVASVECSVHGAFYNHLPEAREFFGPKVVEDSTPIAECLRQLSHIGAGDENKMSVEITSNDPRGVQVLGHTYSSTGLPFSTEADQIIIDIQRGKSGPNSSLFELQPNFMPRAPEISFGTERIFVCDSVSDRDGGEQKKDAECRLETASNSSKTADVESSPLFDTDQPHINEQIKQVPEVAIGSKTEDSKHGEDSGATKDILCLEVRNWNRNPHKDALIYIPGFNSCLKHSLETLGQFLAMSGLSEHVHPILYAWPSGQVATYRHAAWAAATDRNKEKFIELLNGLSAAGIQNVHFMSHSMGAQTLLNVFDDKSDGVRSDASMCFGADPSFGNDELGEDDRLMICKSITMLNPDFPLEAFIDHAFLSIRRICSHITVVADKKDQALFFSQAINGFMHFLGRAQPQVLDVRGGYQKTGYHYQRVIGREVESMYFPESNNPDTSDEEQNKTKNVHDQRILFCGTPPVLLGTDDTAEEKSWLDIDVIDTTSIDININNLRHSAFNVNPILVKDLEELIITGRRAEKRSSLLYREGNIFSYAHIPSFVSL